MATTDGFETFDLAVDLVIAPELSRWEWKDEDEHAHARRLGIISDTEHQPVDAARAHILAMLEERTGPFADAASWASWRWEPTWPTPRLPDGRSPNSVAVTSCRTGGQGRRQEAELS
ncbi:hypothetical protein [Streptomyces sp. NPDC057579]|uniref:hypothetical protein n=1 Tax=Streptomyces sp. NPDC057579 TaxID=3346172 RepID=UPI0036B4511D